jgi:hypothetical protein
MGSSREGSSSIGESKGPTWVAGTNNASWDSDSEDSLSPIDEGTARAIKTKDMDDESGKVGRHLLGFLVGPKVMTNLGLCRTGEFSDCCWHIQKWFRRNQSS